MKKVIVRSVLLGLMLTLFIPVHVYAGSGEMPAVEEAVSEDAYADSGNGSGTEESHGGKATLGLDKYDNPMQVSVTDRTIRYSMIKKKSRTLRAIRVRKAQGFVSYIVLGGDRKVLKLKEDGKIKVKKGTKKDVYTLKIRIYAGGNSEYLAKSEDVIIRIKVK